LEHLTQNLNARAVREPNLQLDFEARNRLGYMIEMRNERTVQQSGRFFRQDVESAGEASYAIGIQIIGIIGIPSAGF
jgi:hypothetical protein